MFSEYSVPECSFALAIASYSFVFVTISDSFVHVDLYLIIYYFNCMALVKVSDRICTFEETRLISSLQFLLRLLYVMCMPITSVIIKKVGISRQTEYIV